MGPFLSLPVPDDMKAIGEETKPGSSQPPLPEDAGKQTLARLEEVRNASGALSAAQIRGKMQKAMQTNAAVFRTQVKSSYVTC